ncbi:hypothetical protein REPUB_Repub16aG0051300 [Reevesia pubescens]
MFQRPWPVMDRHLILKDWPMEASIEEIDFSTSEIWIQIHNMPITFLTKQNVVLIASIFSKLIMVDFEEGQNIIWNGILRMKVALKVDEPLKRGFTLKRQNKPSIRISFKSHKVQRKDKTRKSLQKLQGKDTVVVQRKQKRVMFTC